MIKNARVFDPATGHDGPAEVVVEDGKVLRFGAGASEGIWGESVSILDAGGRWLAPGFLDLHVHLREPGQEYKEDIASGLRAAAAGGFTAVCPMPNTRPTNDTRAVTEAMVAKARSVGGARLYPIAAVTHGSKGEQLTEMSDLKEAGAIGVSDDGVCVMSAEVMKRALLYARTFDLLVSQHCEDHTMTAGAVMNEGAISTELGLRGWPREAEEIIVARDLILAERTGARYHVAHISTAGAVRLVREAKSRGLSVTAEVTPHHLTLSDKDVIGYRTYCKVNPPLRTEADLEAMIEGLNDGTIDCIATDHAPHSDLEKDCDMDSAAFGINGLELALPMLLTLVEKGSLSPLRMIEALTSAPARVGKLPGGRIEVGAPADLVLFDPQLRWTVRREGLLSRSHNTPLLDREVRGAVLATWVGGEVAYRRVES